MCWWLKAVAVQYITLSVVADLTAMLVDVLMIRSSSSSLEEDYIWDWVLWQIKLRCCWASDVLMIKSCSLEAGNIWWIVLWHRLDWDAAVRVWPVLMIRSSSCRIEADNAWWIVLWPIRRSSCSLEADNFIEWIVGWVLLLLIYFIRYKARSSTFFVQSCV